MEHPHQERQKIQEMGCERKEDVHYLMASYSRKGENGYAEQPTSLHACWHSASNLDPKSPTTPQRKRIQVAVSAGFLSPTPIKHANENPSVRGVEEGRSSAVGIQETDEAVRIVVVREPQTVNFCE